MKKSISYYRALLDAIRRFNKTKDVCSLDAAVIWRETTILPMPIALNVYRRINCQPFEGFPLTLKPSKYAK